jgi:CPA1 family monovalent cation:H+ antiporter
MFMSRFITVADSNPGWKNPLIFGWAGMRGVVSLAMALSIPLLMDDGQAFPYRNLILFITFIVILVTLVFQGLTLPWLIRKVGTDDRFSTISEPEQERIIQKKLAKISLEFLENKYSDEGTRSGHLENLLERLRLDARLLEEQLERSNEQTPIDDYQTIYIELLDEQRKLLERMNHSSEVDEDLIRKYLSLIDMEEFKLKQKKLDVPDPQ